MHNVTDEIAATAVAAEPTKRFRAVLPRPLYKKLLKEAVDQEVVANAVLVRILGQYFETPPIR